MRRKESIFDCIFVWPLAMPMQLNLSFNRAAGIDDFSRFSMLFTEHEIHAVHGFWLLYAVTAA